MWRSVLTILSAAIVWTAAGRSDAARADDNWTANSDPAATASYWTEERFRNAEALPMPAGRPVAAAARRPPESRGSQRRARSAGAPPSLDVGEALEVQLYEPDEEPQERPAPERSDALWPTGATDAGAAFTNSRVFPADAVRAYPFRTVGKLFFSAGAVDATCSGTVIERRLVLTAGHCVYDPEPDVFFDDFTFVPAFDRGRARFGRWDWRRVWVATSWLEGDGTLPSKADFAIIEVNDQTVRGRRMSIGEVVGRLAWEESASPDSHVTSLGYAFNLDGGERLQQTNAQVFDVLNPNAFIFGSFLSRGASGGPVAVNFGQRARGQPSGTTRVIGVNSFENTSDFVIGASILNDEFAEILAQACARSRRNCDQLEVVANMRSQR